MSEILNVIIQIIGGGLAGYAAGSKLLELKLRTHVIAGMVGGVVLAQVMRFPFPGLAGGPDAVSILGNLIASGLGGLIFTTIAGFFKEPFKY
jgi:hypothetical protein